MVSGGHDGSMKIGITCGGIGPFADADYLRRSVQVAEQVGFAHYWLPEHVVQFSAYPESRYPYAGGSGQDLPEQNTDAPLQFGDDVNPMSDPRNAIVDPVVGMTWLAAATSRIEIGTNILILPQRNPVILAKALATLDGFAGGRVVLGVGVGWAKEESSALGVDFSKRGKRTDEAIRLMRQLWTTDTTSFSGAFHDFTDAYSFPKPARTVPILIGGESEAAVQRVARLGDGWLPYNLPVEDAPAIIGRLKEMTREAGRDPDALRIIKIVYSHATPDDLQRYRDAGVTEFNIASSGEIPFEQAAMEEQMGKLAERFIQPFLTV